MSFSILDGTEDIHSGFSSARSSIIEEVRHIHPAYRCTTPVEDKEEDEQEECIAGEEEAFNPTTAFQHPSEEASINLAESPIEYNEHEGPTLIIQSPTPVHPIVPYASTTALEPATTPTVPTAEPRLLSTTQLPTPILLPDWPPWETATTNSTATTSILSSALLHPHSRGKSVEDHRYKLERELRRTMSLQSEKVSRLMRKGSMRLKEAAARASSVGRVRGGGGVVGV